MRYVFLRKAFLYTALVLLIFYLATIAYVFVDEAGLVFFPSDRYNTSPSDSAWTYSEITIQTRPDKHLYGWKISGQAPDSSGPVILYFPENAGNISWEFNEFSVLCEVSSAIYVFDYYGFGKSTGIISEENILKTARDAIVFLERKERIVPQRIVLYGHQLGAFPALTLGSEGKVHCVIIESPFTSIPELANEIYPILPLKQVMSIRMNNIAVAQKLKSPLLVIHSTEDKIIPHHHGESVFEAAPRPKKFLLLESGGHQNALQKNRTLFLQTFSDFCK